MTYVKLPERQSFGFVRVPFVSDERFSRGSGVAQRASRLLCRRLKVATRRYVTMILSPGEGLLYALGTKSGHNVIISVLRARLLAPAAANWR